MPDNPQRNAPSPYDPDDHEQQAGQPAFFAPNEPPVTEDDTQPRSPVVTPQLPLDSVPAAVAPPSYPTQESQAASLLADVSDWASGRVAEHPDEQLGPARGRVFLLLTVMVGTVCLCVAMIGLAGFAGYRDGLATNDARVTQTLATGIAQQYATGSADLKAGFAELAAARFEWIVETIQAPTEYALDSPVQLAVARTIAAYTDTPLPTLTPTPPPQPTATASPTPTVTAPATATLDPLQDPAYYYNQAATAMSLVRYEEAIEWLDALIALDPTYRTAEVNAMLLEALTQQGRLYLLGMNEDGEDKLARGVLLIYRADDIGAVEPEWLLGQAIFVERFVNARNYVAGGNYAAAIPVLEGLCAENCEWSYRGVSVSDLLERARTGS